MTAKPRRKPSLAPKGRNNSAQGNALGHDVSEVQSPEGATQSTWPIMALSDVCTKISDGTHHSPTVQHSEAAPGRFKYVTSKNIRPWGLDLGDIAYLDEDVHREIYSRCNPELGDVLLTKDGANTGNVAINTLEEEFSLLSSVALLKLKRDIVDSRFVRYYLESPVGSKRLLGDMTGTAIRRIILRKIKETEIPVAPLDDQRRIVAEIEKQFTRLEAGVAALRRVQANLKRYRAAVLKAACEGRLVPTEAELARTKGRPFESGQQLLARILTKRRQSWQGRGKYKEPEVPDVSALPDVPKGWSWCRLEQVCLVVGGLTKNPKRATLSNQLPYLRVANVYANELRLDEIQHIGVSDAELPKLLVEKGDLLIVEGNGSKDQIGRLAVWDGSIASCVHQNHLIKARPVDVALSKWLLNWLLSPNGRHFIELVASSTSGLYTLSTGKVGDLMIALPPLAEQTRIVAEVERRLSVVEELEAVVTTNLQRATRLRQSILQKAFTGELLS